MQMSKEACNSAKGQWIRSSCITLYKCTNSRPREGEITFNRAFEDWVVENEVEITGKCIIVITSGALICHPD